MKKLIKFSMALKAFAIVCLSVVVFAGCSSGSSSTETVDTTITDTSSATMAPADTMMKTDSMPMVDSNATTRPDGRKTKN